MKQHLLTAALALIVSASALASTDTNSAPLAPATVSADPTTAAFQHAAGSVSSAQIIVAAPANDPLDAALTSLGGFPATADISHSHRPVPHSFAIGYDAKGTGVVVVYLNDQNQPQVSTDPDALAVYQLKAHRLVPTAPAGGAVAEDHSGPFGTSSTGESSSHHSGVKGIEIGMTKAQVIKKFGRPQSIMFEDTDHEQWIVRPFSPTRSVMGSLVTQISSNFGIFGGTAQNAGDSMNPKGHTYSIKFDGDRVCDVNKMTM